MSVYALDIDQELKVIDQFLENDLDSAQVLAENLLDASSSHDDHYGRVIANLYLGYILKKKGDFARSVIYYLDGIRYADQEYYENIESDRIWLRRNLANTFRTFNANRLATDYNLEAINIAEEIGNSKQLISLLLNQALVYQNNNQLIHSIETLKNILPLIDQGDEYYYRVTNQIGLVYLEDKDYDNAKKYFEKLLEVSDSFIPYKAKALHNLGEIAYETGSIDESINLISLAVSLKQSTPNTSEYSLFNSYKNLGRYLFEIGKIDEAEDFLIQAEKISHSSEWDPKSFEIYKTLSNLYYHSGQNDKGMKYSQLYFSKVQNFIETQEEVEKEAKEYNFDLITARYFDQVEKQEKIASILFISKLSSGSLLALLILVIFYYQFEKTRVRKSIERELRVLNVLD